MSKFLLAALVFISLFSTCNKPAHKTGSNLPLPLAELPADTTPDYTTTVIEADLPSPRKEMKGTIEGVQIVVNYGSPAVKKRNLWGALIPYDKVWRMGANEATRFTTEEAISIAGQTLAPGTYGLFSIPRNGAWQVIFNRKSDQWGAYEYDETQDVLRVEVTPQMVENNAENLDFTINKNSLVLSWGTLRLPVFIEKS